MSAPLLGRLPTAEEEVGLRSLVAARAGLSSRRRLPTTVHAGRPGGASSDFVDLPSASLEAAPASPVDAPLDAGLCADVAAALLSRSLVVLGQPAFWLVRQGELTTEDVDLRWYAAARTAYAEAEVPLLMIVVTRHGWYDPGSDLRRKWRRLRSPRPRRA